MTCPFCEDVGRPGRQRSTAQHNRFFAVVKAAFMNWPANEEFQPDTALHLRKWIIAKAGWRHVMTIESPDFAEQAAECCLAMLKQRGEPGWIARVGGKLVVVSARSIAYSDMRHSDAVAYFTRAEDLLCEILDVKNGDELLKKSREAA